MVGDWTNLWLHKEAGTADIICKSTKGQREKQPAWIPVRGQQGFLSPYGRVVGFPDCAVHGVGGTKAPSSCDVLGAEGAGGRGLHGHTPFEVAFRGTSQRHMKQVIEHKYLDVNTAEPSDLIYNQIIRLSISALAVTSLPKKPRHFSSS